MKIDSSFIDNKKLNLKKLLTIVCCIILFIVLIVVYSRYKATTGLKIIEYKVTDSSLPDSFHGIKLVHFSDVYFGNTVDLKYLQSIADDINKLEPDIVVFTGDLITIDIDNDTKNDIINVLNSINSSIGKYAIKGNSDNDLFDEIIGLSDFTNLTNSSTNIYYKSDIPISIGNQDISSDLFSVLLIHEPDEVINLSNSFNLILAGHSLNGQINLPIIKQIFLPAGARKYYNGYYDIDGKPMYVSSGIGTTSFKYRFNNKPSINLYRLTKY